MQGISLTWSSADDKQQQEHKDLPGLTGDPVRTQVIRVSRDHNENTSAVWEKNPYEGEHFHSCQHRFQWSAISKAVFTFWKNWTLELSADQDYTSATGKFKTENTHLARADTLTQHFNKL